MARTATTKRQPAPAPPTVSDGDLDNYFASLQGPPAEPAPLFAEEEPTPRQTPPQLRPCVICALRNPPALAGHDVCAACAAEPDAARARMEQQRDTLIRQQQQASRASEAAYAALSEAERARWDALCWLRVARDNGDAPPDDLAKLERTLAAYKDAGDARISGALRACYHRDEELFWANAADREGQRRINVRLAQLAVCLEDMSDAATPTRDAAGGPPNNPL